MDRNAEKKICETVDALRREEKEKLEKLYKMRKQDLIATERSRLLQMALQLPVEAQKRIVSALEEANVLCAYTVWQRVYEKLPEISFGFIEWEISPEEENTQGDCGKKDSKDYWHTWMKSLSENKIKNKEKTKLLEEARNVNMNRIDTWCAELLWLTLDEIKK